MPSADPFKLQPTSIPADFVWSGKNFHLTYPTFLDLGDCLHAVSAMTSTPLLGYSHVWERSKASGGVEYEHTHFALMFSAAIRVMGCHRMDVRVLDSLEIPDYMHPQIQPKVTIKQMEQIFVSYHPGRKFNIETGKIEYTKPVALNQKLPPLFDFTRAIMNEITAAPSLFEACIAAEVKPRSVSDVKALRDAEAAAHTLKKHRSIYSADSFIAGVIPDGFQVVHLYGPSGIGKTKYALGGVPSVKCPLLIKPFNSVASLEYLKKNFVAASHDCLVLDEVDLRFMKREEVICFLDMDEPAVFNVRFTTLSLPPVRKILLSNLHPSSLYQAADPAIARRIEIIFREQPLYKCAYVNPATNTPVTDAMTQCAAPARTPLARLPMQAI